MVVVLAMGLIRMILTILNDLSIQLLVYYDPILSRVQELGFIKNFRINRNITLGTAPTL